MNSIGSSAFGTIEFISPPPTMTTSSRPTYYQPYSLERRFDAAYERPSVNPFGSLPGLMDFGLADLIDAVQPMPLLMSQQMPHLMSPPKTQRMPQPTPQTTQHQMPSTNLSTKPKKKSQTKAQQKQQKGPREECVVCGTSFLTPSGLKRHLRTKMHAKNLNSYSSQQILDPLPDEAVRLLIDDLGPLVSDFFNDLMV